MLKALKTAYDAGWRAGTSRGLIRPGGTRNILRAAEPYNPYTHWTQIVKRACWNAGYYDGLEQRVNEWLKS